jgi:hypothetical protein
MKDTAWRVRGGAIAGGSDESSTLRRFKRLGRHVLQTALRATCGRRFVERRLASPLVARGTRVLVLGVYLADREHAATHLVQRFAAAQSCQVRQAWVGLNGPADSEALAQVTVARVDERVAKFTLMNRLLAAIDWQRFDYLILTDDDIRVPHGFLDAFLHIQQRHDFALAQPARTLWSHSDHGFVLARPGLGARWTRFVEIGPLVSIRSDLSPLLLPFDEASPMGWGYDHVWPLLIEAAGLRMGIVDRTPVDHSLRPQTATYARADVSEVMQRYLSNKAHLSLARAQRTLQAYW